MSTASIFLSLASLASAPSLARPLRFALTLALLADSLAFFALKNREVVDSLPLSMRFLEPIFFSLGGSRKSGFHFNVITVGKWQWRIN